MMIRADDKLHRELKILAAQKSTHLEKLADIYLRVGLRLRLDKPENLEKIERLITDGRTITEDTSTTS